MNKLTKIFLAIIAGIDVTLTIFTPILLATLWINISGLNFLSYTLYSLGLFATLFRAIKIGWLKNG